MTVIKTHETINVILSECENNIIKSTEIQSGIKCSVILHPTEVTLQEIAAETATALGIYL